MTHWEEIKGFFMELWESVTRIFTGWWEAIKTFFMGLNPWELIKGGWEKLKEGIAGILKGIFGGSIIEDWTASLHSYFAEQDFAPEGQQMFGSLRQGMQTELAGISSMTRSSIAGMKEWMAKQAFPISGLGSVWDPEKRRPMTSEEITARAHREIAADLAAAGVKHIGGGVFAPIFGSIKGPTGLQGGGIAMRPMLASIAEKQPEAVIPLDRLGGLGKTMNLYIELDGRIIAEAVEVRLTDDIRLKTGVKI
ncbi:unnamed protein product [marine sediment metagenome]|uniref:Phage tail tape measure protein domain-containing protein n=1 Tax=marine sediment metagenome TaxID=412755 RepID=X1D980_9ZZZZ